MVVKLLCSHERFNENIGCVTQTIVNKHTEPKINRLSIAIKNLRTFMHRQYNNPKAKIYIF